MRTLKHKAKLEMFEHMRDRVKECIFMPAFIQDIEESDSLSFEFAAKYMKDGNPFLYQFSEDEFDYNDFENGCVFDFCKPSQLLKLKNSTSYQYDSIMRSIESEYKQHGNYERALKTVLGE